MAEAGHADERPDAAPAAERSVAAVLDRLRGQILDRTLLPGEQIRQEEMARRLGISRVPLREALRVLTTEGLLTHRPHQGYFVAKVSAEKLRQINTLLEFLETDLIRSVSWPDDERLSELRTLNTAMADSARTGEFATVSRLNRDLHNRIFALSPNEIHVAEAERFWTLSEPYRLLHVTSTDTAIAIEQHEQLIDALAAHDRALCLRVLNEHRRATQNAALNRLTALEPGPSRAAG